MSSVMTWVSRYTAPVTVSATPRGISKRPDEPDCRPAVSTWSAIVGDSDMRAGTAQRAYQETSDAGTAKPRLRDRARRWVRKLDRDRPYERRIVAYPVGRIYSI